MSQKVQTSVNNSLLRALPAKVFLIIAPLLERVWAEQEEVLIDANRIIDYIYFPESGIVSTTATTRGDGQTEIGITGREGLVGIPMLLGADRTPQKSFVQAGRSLVLRVGAENFREVVAQSVPMRDLFLRYVQAYLVQMAHSIVSNAHHRIEARLARWLLMCHDRSEGDEIRITHEFMSMMIAAQRTGVTLCLHVLEGAGMIRSQRGRVTVLNREQLEDLAGEAYGAPEAEYSRLIGPWERVVPNSANANAAH